MINNAYFDRMMNFYYLENNIFILKYIPRIYFLIDMQIAAYHNYVL